jgi:hypothetical protein
VLHGKLAHQSDSVLFGIASASSNCAGVDFRARREGRIWRSGNNDAAEIIAWDVDFVGIHDAGVVLSPKKLSGRTFVPLGQ